MHLQELVLIAMHPARHNLRASCVLLLFIHFVHNALNLHIEARQLVSKRREHTDQDQRWQVKKQLDEHVEAGVIGRILVEL